MKKPIIPVALVFLALVLIVAPVFAQKKLFIVNDRVKVWWHEKWEICTILAVRDDKYKIRFEENEDLYDKWVPHKIVHNFTYRIGDIILVKKDAGWLTGRVIAVSSAKYKVHIIGTESLYDFWAGPADIKDITYNAGEKVQVMWMDDWYDAVILRYTDGRYLVHFEGFSDTQDQWVTVDLIRKKGQ